MLGYYSGPSAPVMGQESIKKWAYIRPVLDIDKDRLEKRCKDKNFQFIACNGAGGMVASGNNADEVLKQALTKGYIVQRLH